jgi:predicted HAD superfamily Cof-like phosphohydrolase
LEEVAEMVETLVFNTQGFDPLDGVNTTVHNALGIAARMLKSGAMRASVTDRKEFLDSLADQIVTAVGVGHCAGMKTADACYMVDSSNWSKFDADGLPIFDANGKITKGPGYEPPNLEGLY